MRTFVRRGARWLIPLLLIIAVPIAVYAAYDVTGVSDAEPFSVGTLPTHTATATPPVTVTSTVSPTATVTPAATATATATPRACASVRDASLEFQPDAFEREGDGPFDVVLKLRNTGRQSYAVTVVLALNTINGAGYFDRVDLLGGATWTLNGATSFTTHGIGDIAPRGEASIVLRIHMLPNWAAADEVEAKLRVSIHSASCTRHPSPARATITLKQEGGHGHGQSALEGAAATAGDSPSPSPATSTPSMTATLEPSEAVATPTVTPSPGAAAEPPTPDATATPS